PAILPFFAVSDVREAMIISAVSVLSFLFFVGMFKSRITKIRWFISGFETLLFGSLSCGLGFTLGRIAAGFFH
ncbi:MAG: VIT1/CCC1 transporter family protein, partial [Candidatus Omnitrophica bacterium]|nr:VIT1/CCC1 transporter family protein [Candidatus Omnitrophota bacterium]